MTDVLLLADLHGDFSKLDKFLDLGPDMVVIAGDLTDFGPAEAAKEVLSRIDVPCFVIPGNCDPRSLIETVDASDAVCLHGVTMEIGRITFTGLGASNPTPFNTPFELQEEEIDRLMEKATARMKKNIFNVLVCHAPPLGTLDRIGDASVGSSSLRKHMNKYDLVFCAHIHEAKGVEEVDSVTVVNPGPASEGNCAMVHFGDEAGDFTVELLTL
jgi:Icc-related predicted phosphoesterase